MVGGWVWRGVGWVRREEARSTWRVAGSQLDFEPSQVRQFFNGLAIAEIVWTFTHRNRPSGEAFVVFASIADAAKALSNDMQVLGKRYIEVFAVTLAQVDAARDNRKAGAGAAHSHRERAAKEAAAPSGNNGEAETVVMMYGLPYSATVAEVEGFFAGYGFVPGSVRLDSDASGKGVGTGQLTFVSAQEAVRAMHERHRKFIGKRYVSVHFPGRKGLPLPPLIVP